VFNEAFPDIAGLNAFSDHTQVERLAHSDDRAHDGRVVSVGQYALYVTLVDLHFAYWKPA
jgi:hypothetical protein